MTKQIYEIEYMYRDAQNWKNWGSFFVSGRFAIETLAPYLVDNEFFIPASIDLPALNPRFPESHDHLLHTFVQERQVETGAPLLSRRLLKQKIIKAHERGWFDVLRLKDPEMYRAYSTAMSHN